MVWGLECNSDTCFNRTDLIDDAEDANNEHDNDSSFGTAGLAKRLQYLAGWFKIHVNRSKPTPNSYLSVNIQQMYIFISQHLLIIHIDQLKSSQCSYLSSKIDPDFIFIGSNCPRFHIYWAKLSLISYLSGKIDPSVILIW